MKVELVLLTKLLRESEKLTFNNKKLLYIMLGLIATLVIDSSIVKVYDLIDKTFISQRVKFLLFSVNTSVCLLLVFVIINYIEKSFRKHTLTKRFNLDVLYRISLNSLFVIGTLVGLLIFQQLYHNYYHISISIFIIMISYGTAAGFIIRLSMLFISWYFSNHNWILALYATSMLFIAFNLIMTGLVTDVKLTDRSDIIREYIGGSSDVSAGKYVLLNNLYLVSSFMAFMSIWMTTIILVNFYRDKDRNPIIYWIIFSIPLFYYLVNYFYQLILTNLLSSSLTVDPITVSIALTAFLSLSKPIGGLIFAFAFWNMAKNVGYEKNIKAYMNIAGWGIFLIFAANQANVQSLAPYPPFGLATISVLILAAFLMLLGIYNTAAFVSANTNLRKSIRQHAMESAMLGFIGQAQLQKEVEKRVKEITRLKYSLERETELPIEFDEKELKDYLKILVTVVRRKSDQKDRPL